MHKRIHRNLVKYFRLLIIGVPIYQGVVVISDYITPVMFTDSTGNTV